MFPLAGCKQADKDHGAVPHLDLRRNIALEFAPGGLPRFTRSAADPRAPCRAGSFSIRDRTAEINDPPASERAGIGIDQSWRTGRRAGARAIGRASNNSNGS